MSIVKAIEVNHFEMMKKRGWDKTYWFFDIHSTIVKPNYKAGDIPTEFYPHAKETLQYLSKLDNVCMILYTCSHPHEIKQYEAYFESFGIEFSFVNKNPQVVTQADGYGCYEDKPYINVLFDDKAGFDADKDWKPVLDYMKFMTEGQNEGLDEDDIDQLYGEIDNEGLGYWVQNYSSSWEKSGKDYELSVLLKNAREAMNKLEGYLEEKGVLD